MTTKQKNQQALADEAEYRYRLEVRKLMEVPLEGVPDKEVPSIMSQYPREAMDVFQDLVTQSYGSPVNPTQNVNGVLEARNPLDDKVLATLPADHTVEAGNIEWVDGVEHDDNRISDQFKGWNAYGNKTTTEHKETPTAAAGEETEPEKEPEVETEEDAKEDTADGAILPEGATPADAEGAGADTAEVSGEDTAGEAAETTEPVKSKSVQRREEAMNEAE